MSLFILFNFSVLKLDQRAFHFALELGGFEQQLLEVGVGRESCGTWYWRPRGDSHGDILFLNELLL